jgi:hypothetical protein
MLPVAGSHHGDPRVAVCANSTDYAEFFEFAAPFADNTSGLTIPK